MKHNQGMLSNILHAIKATDSFIPLGNHSSFQKSWIEDVDNVLHTSLTDLEEKEKEVVPYALDFIEDSFKLFLQNATNPPWHSMSKAQRMEKVRQLKAKPQIEQRSEEWYKNFQHVLTASEFSTLFSNTKKRKDLIISKAVSKHDENTFFRTACPTDEMSAFGWGIRFEPVVKQIFEFQNKCKIFEPGRLQHPTNKFLAASPDGIIEDAEDSHLVGRLIEIKCPYSRKIGGEIPLDYWIQMQIQMEVTDMDECEYIEVEILSRKPKQENSPDLSSCAVRGILWLFKQIVEEDQPFDYKYMFSPIDMENEDKERPTLEGYECMEKIPWGMKGFHRKLVQRDRSWYKTTIPWQDLFWNDVDHYKENPSQYRTYEPCLIMDD